MSSLIRLSCPFVLASESPRRQALLERIGVPFRVRASPADEVLPEPVSLPSVVEQLALRKARPVAAEVPSALVLAADTVVAHDGEILNKPDAPDDAHRMLRRLSATSHTVYTGVALVQEGTQRETSVVESTGVVFGSLSDEEIEAYVASRSPMDKAGSYGIQDHTGALFVDRIEGDYYNVVGLPLRRLYQILRREYADLLETPNP
jgi:septum formation protein